ncbi:hypothetical protein KRR26_32560 [Corallococcus sp. M34]|uniref:hypothetical protein n=1 Tax=Citreicoccus inhibens TaxID=2849499 RepID=UPI001C245E2F|nr:hypothetical protein [Citreicoccus inhibens]MBU8900351.1 hypothetical protein [Citreicoccus inhibens]
MVVFGSTGTAGQGAIQACLAEPGVSEVRSITRRPLGISHPKLREVSWSDFANLGGIAHHFKGADSCLFCLGTSVRNVKGEAPYREIHVTYALAAARTLLAESPDASFVYLSGSGTKRTSSMMWARVKAEAEDRLAELKLARLANVRPAGILPMQPTGATRWLLAPLLKMVPPLGIRSIDLGRAMLRVGLDRSWRGSRTLENKDLKALIQEA